MTQMPSSTGAPGTSTPTSGDADTGDRTALIKDDATEVAGVAKQGVSEVAQEAGAQAREVAGKAKDHARELVGQATSEVRARAGEQAQRAAGGLDQLAQRVQALVSGRPEEAGPLRDYAAQLGDQVQRSAEQLRSRGVDGVVTDLRSLAQRRPGLFLAGAAAAGFAVGRLVKAQRSDSAGGDGSGVYTGGMGPSRFAGEPDSGGAPARTTSPIVQPYPTPGLEDYPVGGGAVVVDRGPTA